MKFNLEQMNNTSISYHIVPSAAPTIMSARAANSTRILIQWSVIPFKKIHGILIGYEIRYRVSHQVTWHNISVKTIAFLEKPIDGLFKYTSYEFKIAGTNSAGIGVYSAIARQSTPQDGSFSCPILLLIINIYVGVIGVCGTMEFQENSSRNTEFWHFLHGTAE